MLFLGILAASGLVAGLPSPSPVKDVPAGSSFNIRLVNATQSKWTLKEGDGLVDRAVKGPQMGVNFPDPSLIYTHGKWVAYATTSGGKNVPLATSPDAWTWTLEDKDALPDPGSWAESTPEAPDVQINDDGTFVMYYAIPRKNGKHCIGAATSKTATGPFTPQSTPLICDDAGGGTIDPGGFDDGIHRWIYWKVDGSFLGGATTCPNGGTPGSTYLPTPIKMQRVGRDALTLLGHPKTILDNDGAGDDGIVEAPSVVRAPFGVPGFLLFFSTHCYSSDLYDIQYAWSPTIDGKYTHRRTLASTAGGAGMYGPGGLDVSPDRRNAVFHGRLAADEGADGVRELYAATLQFEWGDVSGINPWGIP